MKKGKITMIITIGLACFALVMIMTMQFKIVNETDITAIENMREAELKTELANWKEKYEETSEQYDETQAKIQEYKEKEQSDIESSELIKKELEQANTLLGKTDVEGEGIVITLRETNLEETGMIDANDILEIINELRNAGAEAISVNEERIINMTDIVFINEIFVNKINGQKIESPYVIKAIGNPSYLESALIGNGGPVDRMQKIGHNIAIEKPNKVTIHKYNGEIKTKYIE